MNPHSPKKVLVKPRSIPVATTLHLYARAAGRCEFDGCNRYVLEHGPTGKRGLYAERAHIWAFSEKGPRGQTTKRPADIHDISNLMVLCRECHREVDVEHPEDYPVEVLRAFKRDHEKRVYWLTDLAKDRGTVPVVVRGMIAGRTVEISDEEMQVAVAPNYLRRRERIDVDLATVPDSPDESYWAMARATIDRNLDRLARVPVNSGGALKVSVFALAAIPILAYLGSKLSDKHVVDLYQRHRVPETWNWQEGMGHASYVTRCLAQGSGEPALLLNLSGKNGVETVTQVLGRDGPIYEMTLEGEDPSPLFLNTRGDLEAFTHHYFRFLSEIRAKHPGADRVHVFPAVPAPVAVTLGRARLPKVDSRFLIYDRDHRAAGFAPTLEINVGTK